MQEKSSALAETMREWIHVFKIYYHSGVTKSVELLSSNRYCGAVIVIVLAMNALIFITTTRWLPELSLHLR